MYELTHCAVTAHISTDVAAAPLMWVLPLSLYLLTWVLVFQSRPLLPHNWMLALQPVAIAVIIYLLAEGYPNLLVLLGGHLVSFFVIAMACHGELARTRPAASHLTGFYVALSFGGMVGGLFAGLVAPYTFSWIAEYPILLALAVTSNRASIRRLGKRWTTLHRLVYVATITGLAHFWLVRKVVAELCGVIAKAAA